MWKAIVDWFRLAASWVASGIVEKFLYALALVAFGVLLTLFVWATSPDFAERYGVFLGASLTLVGILVAFIMMLVQAHASDQRRISQEHNASKAALREANHHCVRVLPAIELAMLVFGGVNPFDKTPIELGIQFGRDEDGLLKSEILDAQKAKHAFSLIEDRTLKIPSVFMTLIKPVALTDHRLHSLLSNFVLLANDAAELATEESYEDFEANIQQLSRATELIVVTLAMIEHDLQFYDPDHDLFIRTNGNPWGGLLNSFYQSGVEPIPGYRGE